ncbi:hypothetical protein [Gilliamella sp. Bif1-4]|uniref:hypothetical protein n=1 Tax=Gilliamella sp. Bif1-4 TaxID=3120233 RepID=UPI00080EC5EB|nr:hypothetical protein [Gilliamella apicola]OCG41336.1 hypothetical protein A9G25_06365 [Gilliamella apicola]
MNYIKSILLIILLIPTISQAELSRIYTGTIGQNKVEFYFEYDFAIYIDNKDHQVKNFDIRNSSYSTKFKSNDVKSLDKIVIENVDSLDSGPEQLTGYTFNGDKVNLQKTFEYHEYDEHSLREVEFNNIDYLQESSTKDFYFKVVVSKKKGEKAEIVGIKIYSKHDGRLIQTITGIQGCKFNSYVSIKAHKDFDFNFNGDNNDFYLTKNRNYGPNRIADYYAYDKKQQQFVKLNLDGNGFRFAHEEKEATSYKTCPGKKANDEISLIDDFQYIGNNRYKRVKTECLYKSGQYLNKESNQFEYKKERACNPKEIKACRNYIDTNDYDDY